MAIVILTATAIGIIIPQLNPFSQLLIIFTLVYLSILCFSTFIRSIDPAWILALTIFFELIGWPIKTISPSTPVLWVVPLLPLPFVILSLINSPRHLLPSLRELYFWFYFLGYATLSLFWSLNPNYGFEKLLILIVRGLIPGVYIFLLYKIHHKFSWNDVLLVSAFYSVAVILFGQESPEYPGRIALPGSNPIWDARTALMGSAIALWWQGKKVWLRLSVFCLGIVTALVTQSRGPLLAFMASVVLTMVVQYVRATLRKKLMWCALLIYGLIGIVITELLLVDFGNLKIELVGRYATLGSVEALTSDENVVSRLGVLQQALDIFKSNPVFGVGLGGFVGTLEYPHNIIFEVAAELGLIGFLLWIAVVINSMILARKNRLLLALLIQALFYALTTGDLGFNYEYILLTLIILGSRTKQSEEVVT